MTRRELGQAALGALLNVSTRQQAWSSSFGAPGLAEVSRWRADFPALNQTVNGHPLAYLDSAATTQRPAAVLAALLDYYRHDNANPGGTLHALARRAHEQYEGARRVLAAFINAADPDEVVWVRGTTEGINLIASAWARPRLRPGDEVLLTVAEHTSNLLPWRLLAENTGAALRYLDVDDEGRVQLDDLDRKLSERTRLLSFSHVSNVAGYINPAAEICARARRAGARVLIDAAQSAPHVPLDVQNLGCDFLVFSSHKMLGPMGVGVLWGRRELLEDMSPYQAGSNMAHEVGLTSQEFEHAAHKFGAGTPNVSGPVGLAAAVQYLGNQNRSAIERHEAEPHAIWARAAGRHPGPATTWTPLRHAAAARLLVRVGRTLSRRNPTAPGYTGNCHPRRRSGRTASLEALRRERCCAGVLLLLHADGGARSARRRAARIDPQPRIRSRHEPNGDRDH